jgi:ubiquitin-like-conjugating enzyme ATG3
MESCKHVDTTCPSHTVSGFTDIIRSYILVTAPFVCGIDNYWRTPRVFLFGYDEAGSPMPPEKVFEDIMQDYAQKTVTIEPHPHTNRPHASIHPCQHSAAMKRVSEHKANMISTHIHLIACVGIILCSGS